MYALFAHLVQLFDSTRIRLGPADVPRRLLENAEARAGIDPYQAAELRSAAIAYLSVVR